MMKQSDSSSNAADSGSYIIRGTCVLSEVSRVSFRLCR
jgi:hypothetical protein